MNDVRAVLASAGVGEVVVDAPPRNIAGPALWLQLEAALSELREQQARVVVLTSAVKGYFVAHGSLEGIISFFDGDGDAVGDVDAQSRVMRELDRGPMVSIAAIDGQAWGGGAELCWSCDFRVASDQASFAQPEVNIGLTPGWGGVTKVAHLAGEAVALRLAVDGRPIDGSEALRVGLVDRFVGDGSARLAALEWATWLASRPAWAVAGNKALVKGIRGRPIKEALRMELETFAHHCSVPEAMALIRSAQAHYDGGGDSYDAFGLDPPAAGSSTER